MLAKEYSPFGSTIYSVGDFDTDYGYTGELTDGTGLINLRSRYYDPGTGRFITKDTWSGDYQMPATLVKWLYANSNPVRYTDPSGNCFTFTSWGAFWSNLSVEPIWGFCNSSSGTSQNTAATSTATATNTCTPTALPTQTVTPTSVNLTDLGIFTITYYVTALEDDPYFQTHGPYSGWEDQTGIVPGLDQNKKYNLNWVYGDDGILKQGQGRSRFGEYVTKDWINSTDSKLAFTYGKGGKYGPPREWETVAAGDSRLAPYSWVMIEAYPEKGPFEVLDTGEAIGASHLDVFIGDKFMSEALSLVTTHSRVYLVK